jgi:NAD(P)-dependent dehydrogenase (short-subunit alcohol dehydrogenase family)
MTLSKSSPAIRPPEVSLAVVTGAARGIGAAICQRFLADGYFVIGLDLASESCSHTSTGHIMACDVSDDHQVETMATDIQNDYGPVNVLVNNAGIWSFGAIEDTSAPEFQRVLSVNLLGTFHCTKYFGASMLQQGRGSIVNMVSIAAHAANPQAGAYSASKAGVLAFTRQTALEWGARGVRSNAVGPGFVPTPGTGAVYDDDAVRNVRSSAVPLQRLATPEDIANTVAFLASNEAAYITGQVLYVDGGISQALMTLIPRPPTVAGPHID